MTDFNSQYHPSQYTRRLPAVEWPQDIFIPPQGLGMLPEVSPVNKALVRREFFGYAFKFPNLGQGETQYQVIATNKDGDFWCDGLYVLPVDTGTNTFTNRLSRLSIRDNTNSFQLFSPYLYIMAMTDPAGQTPQAGRVQQFLQPYCFVRGAPIEVTASTPAQAGGRVGQDIYGVLLGWKEYENAAS